MKAGCLFFGVVYWACRAIAGAVGAGLSSALSQWVATGRVNWGQVIVGALIGAASAICGGDSAWAKKIAKWARGAFLGSVMWVFPKL